MFSYFKIGADNNKRELRSKHCSYGLKGANFSTIKMWETANTKWQTDYFENIIGSKKYLHVMIVFVILHTLMYHAMAKNSRFFAE